MALQGKYNFALIWEAGKGNRADYNSRHPGTTTIDEAATDTELMVSAVVVDAIPDAITVQQVARETETDPTLMALRDAVSKGHMDAQQQPQLKVYAKYFEELCIIDGVVCRADKIIIPGSLQKKIIEIAHEAHQGISKTKQYVRSTMWFPRMDTLIEERLRGCVMCQASTASNQKEPIHPTEMPKQPWSTLCTDLCGPLPTGEYLVLIQCLHSRFPEVAITHSTSAAAVIPAIDKILAAYGTPEILGSDNGPPFNSAEFAQFAKKAGFKHRKITPLTPWANGTAERFMKNLGKVVQIAHADKKNWRHELTKFLRAYRATPHTMTGVTPAALLFNDRKYATNLPSLPRTTTSEVLQRAVERDSLQKQRMKKNADNKQNVREANIKVGDQVLLKQIKRNKLSLAYEVKPYTVVHLKGSQITATNDIHTVTRHVNLFKAIPDGTDQLEGPEGQQEEEEEDVMQRGEMLAGDEYQQNPQDDNPQAATGNEQATLPRRSTRTTKTPARFQDPNWDVSQ
jgi:hypothetical protein